MRCCGEAGCERRRAGGGSVVGVERWWFNVVDDRKWPSGVKRTLST
jgi:hypothetical protein